MIESNDRGDHEDLHFGVYATGVYQYKKQINISGSLRGDYDDNYGFEILPQFNLSGVFDRFLMRLSMGRSIRAADYTERYVSNNLQNLSPGRNLGNPDLAAEKAASLEAGFDFILTENWRLKTSIFSRISNNLIDYVSTNQRQIGSVSEIGTLQDDANYFFAKNITDVNTDGFEIESHLNQYFYQYFE